MRLTQYYIIRHKKNIQISRNGPIIFCPIVFVLIRPYCWTLTSYNVFISLRCSPVSSFLSVWTIPRVFCFLGKARLSYSQHNYIKSPLSSFYLLLLQQSLDHASTKLFPSLLSSSFLYIEPNFEYFIEIKSFICPWKSTMIEMLSIATRT